jgi:hypothetical protein
MHHIPAFSDALFGSNVSGSCANVFRALLDAADLVHLNSLQQQLLGGSARPARGLPSLFSDGGAAIPA